MSNGVALNRSATAGTSAGATNRKTAFGIDEAPDQPRAGDTIDLRPGARHPHRAALLVTGRQLVGANQRLAAGLPGLEPAVQRLRVDAFVAQPRRGALTELQAPLARDDDIAPGIGGGPLRDSAEVTTSSSLGSGAGRRRNPRRCARR